MENKKDEKTKKDVTHLSFISKFLKKKQAFDVVKSKDLESDEEVKLAPLYKFTNIGLPEVRMTLEEIRASDLDKEYIMRIEELLSMLENNDRREK